MILEISVYYTEKKHHGEHNDLCLHMKYFMKYNETRRNGTFAFKDS